MYRIYIENDKTHYTLFASTKKGAKLQLKQLYIVFGAMSKVEVANSKDVIVFSKEFNEVKEWE